MLINFRICDSFDAMLRWKKTWPKHILPKWLGFEKWWWFEFVCSAMQKEKVNQNLALYYLIHHLDIRIITRSSRFIPHGLMVIFIPMGWDGIPIRKNHHHPTTDESQGGNAFQPSDTWKLQRKLCENISLYWTKVDWFHFWTVTMDSAGDLYPLRSTKSMVYSIYCNITLPACNWHHF